jgi:hypothetical protein
MMAPEAPVPRRPDSEKDVPTSEPTPTTPTPDERHPVNQAPGFGIRFPGKTPPPPGGEERFPGYGGPDSPENEG